MKLSPEQVNILCDMQRPDYRLIQGPDHYEMCYRDDQGAWATWPEGHAVNGLIKRGLIAQVGGRYELTAAGRAALELAQGQREG